jgi:hypothetical protein
MKKLVIALILFISVSVFAQTNPVRIRMADSSYSARMIGATGTRTEGIILQGLYNAYYRSHQFNVQATGKYELWIDVAGGSNYSKDATFGGGYGKMISGADLDTLGGTSTVNLYNLPDNESIRQDPDTGLLEVFLHPTGALSKTDEGLLTLVDDTTIERSNGSLQIKDLGIDSTHLGDGARQYMIGILSDSADTVMIVNSPDGVTIGENVSNDLYVKLVTEDVIEDIPEDIVIRPKLSPQIRRSTSERTNIINRKRLRYPEAIAYYDVQSHLGYWEGVDVSDTLIVGTGYKPHARKFFGSPIMNQGRYVWNYFYMNHGTNGDAIGSADTIIARDIENGVVYLLNGMFDRTIADIDTNYMMDNPADTVYIYERSAYAGDTLVWNVTDFDDIEFTFNATNINGNFAIDTLQYPFEDGEYYVIEFERAIHDTSTNHMDLRVLSTDANTDNYYNYFQISNVFKNNWFKTTILYKHTKGSLPYWRHTAVVQTTTKIRRFKVGKILNPDECIFTKEWYFAHVRDALDNYPAMEIDTSLFDVGVNPRHLAPFQGLMASARTLGKFTAIDTFDIDSLGPTLGQMWMLYDNSTGDYSVGDTIYMDAVSPTEFNGPKTLSFAGTDTLKFQQNTYNFTKTADDTGGYVFIPEWKYALDFTFDDDLKASAKTVLVIYGTSGLPSVQEGAYTKWSYDEYFNTTGQVLVWFDFYSSLDDYKYYRDDITCSNRVFGIMAIKGELTGPQKYNLCKRIADDYKSIYPEAVSPQLEWEPFEGYWLEKFQPFRRYRRDMNFNITARNPAITEWGNKAGTDSLILIFNSGGENGFNSGYQQTYEKTNDNRIYMQISANRGETWSAPTAIYYGTESVKNSGDSVSCFAINIIQVDEDSLNYAGDDSLLIGIQQLDSLMSPTRNLLGQKPMFLKTRDLSTFRVIDPLGAVGDEYATAMWGAPHQWGQVDTIRYPAYYNRGSQIYDHMMLKTADRGQTFTLDTVLNGHNKAIGSEWAMATSLDWTYYDATGDTVYRRSISIARNDVGVAGIFHESSDLGNSWTRYVPDSWPIRGGDGAPTALEVLQDGRVIAMYNGYRRDNVGFAQSWDGGRSWKATGFMGAEAGLSIYDAGQWGEPKWPDQLPLNRYFLAYNQILQTRGDHLLAKFNDGTIYIVSEEGQGTVSALTFMRFMKK